MLRQKGQVQLAISNQEMKKKKVNYMQSGLDNVNKNYKTFKDFTEKADQNLTSTKNDIIEKINEMTTNQRDEYMKNMFASIESSKVS